MFTTPGFTDERIHLFLATGLERGDTAHEADEFMTRRDDDPLAGPRVDPAGADPRCEDGAVDSLRGGISRRSLSNSRRSALCQKKDKETHRLRPVSSRIVDTTRSEVEVASVEPKSLILQRLKACQVSWIARHATCLLDKREVTVSEGRDRICSVRPVVPFNAVPRGHGLLWLRSQSNGRRCLARHVEKDSRRWTTRPSSARSSAARSVRSGARRAVPDASAELHLPHDRRP